MTTPGRIEEIGFYTDEHDLETLSRKEICKRGQEGDETLCEKSNCPWYGEPAGCNHPTGNREDAPYGNSAAMREALHEILDIMNDLKTKAPFPGPESQIAEKLKEVTALCKKALKEPARNVDKFNTAVEASMAYRAQRSGDKYGTVELNTSIDTLSWCYSRRNTNATDSKQV